MIDGMRLTCTLTAIAALLAGCGGSSAAPFPTPVPYRLSAVRLPACAKNPRALPLPKHFPKNFPIPPGAAVTRTSVEQGYVIAFGVAPLSFKQSWRFFQRASPRAGFPLGFQDAEPPKEAEGRFTGNGYTGRWRVIYFFGCPQVSYFEVEALHTTHG